jgi:hypothetical protein
MRASFGGVLAAVLLATATMTGCGPAVPQEELGHVVYGENNLPKPKTPYVLPPAPPAPPGSPPPRAQEP